MFRMCIAFIACSTNNRFAIAARHPTIVKIDVRNPRRRLSEIKIVNAIVNQYSAFDVKLNRCVRFMANIPAAAVLNRSNPIPGPP